MVLIFTYFLFAAHRSSEIRMRSTCEHVHTGFIGRTGDIFSKNFTRCTTSALWSASRCPPSGKFRVLFTLWDGSLKSIAAAPG